MFDHTFDRGWPRYVPYVTLEQNDAGVTGNKSREVACRFFTFAVIFSVGAYPHLTTFQLQINFKIWHQYETVS